MYNNAPKDYKCPICLGVAGVENDDTMLRQQDLVYKDDLVSVFINSFFPKDTPGHVIVVPNDHFENIYEVSKECGHRIFEVSQKMALALKKAYGCDGVKLVQNNEPAAGQHAFHYHLHIIPRFEKDDYATKASVKRLAPLEERKRYADQIKSVLAE